MVTAQVKEETAHILRARDVPLLELLPAPSRKRINNGTHWAVWYAQP
jgi:hypothetical protein